MESRQETGKRHEGVGHDPSRLTRVDGGVECSQLHRHSDHATESGEKGGDTDFPVPPVADDDDFRVEEAGVLLENLGQSLGPCLFLSFEQDLNTNGQVIAERGDRSHVHHHPRLVVAGPSPVDAPIFLERLEGPAGPVFHRSRRLDVVMGVQQDRRCALGRWLLCEDRRVAVG